MKPLPLSKQGLYQFQTRQTMIEISLEPDLLNLKESK